MVIESVILKNYFCIALVFLGAAIVEPKNGSPNKGTLSKLVSCTLIAALWPIVLFFVFFSTSSNNKKTAVVTRTHKSIDIKITLAQNDEFMSTIMITKNGEYLTASKTRKFLINELSKGYTRYSCCDNRTSSGACAGHSERHKIKGQKL